MPKTGAGGSPTAWEEVRAGLGLAAAVIDGADAQRARKVLNRGGWGGGRRGDARRRKGEDHGGEGRGEKRRRRTV